MRVLVSGSTDFNQATGSGSRGLLFYSELKQERLADIQYIITVLCWYCTECTYGNPHHAVFGKRTAFRGG